MTPRNENMIVFALTGSNAQPMDTNFCLTLITDLYFQPIPIAIDRIFVVIKTPPEIPLASRQLVMAICHLFGCLGLVEIATP
jgi:hypothetical protein